MKQTVANLPESAGFDHGFQGVHRDVLPGHVHHRSGVVGMRPVLDRHLGQGNVYSLRRDGLQQGCRPFAHRTVIPSLHEHGVCNGDGVGEVFCRRERWLRPLLAHRKDVLSGLQLGVDPQDDVSHLRGRGADTQLQTGERRDFVGKDGRQWLEALISGHDAGLGRQGHIAAGNFDDLGCRHQQRAFSLGVQSLRKKSGQHSQCSNEAG